jgi:hypothetical protein
MINLQHVEAYCLMTYASEDGSEREVLWNSRDGVTPFVIYSPSTGTEMMHVQWQFDRFAPEHVPAVGDRIFVDLTEARARVLAARRVEIWEQTDPERLQARFESREAAIQSVFEGIYAPGTPDILIVTAGYLEHLIREREGRGAVEYLRADRAEPDRSLCYDRKGNPMTTEQWRQAYRDTAYKRVARTEIGPDMFVSTVWLGLDHGYGADPPLTFETMVFTRSAQPDRNGSEFDARDQWRYATEAEAIAGHIKVVEELRREHGTKHGLQ